MANGLRGTATLLRPRNPKPEAVATSGPEGNTEVGGSLQVVWGVFEWQPQIYIPTCTFPMFANQFRFSGASGKQETLVYICL